MERSLRILRISTDTYPEILGGGALHAHEMSKMQSEMGHEVLLLTSDHSDYDAPREEKRDGYTVRRYRELARPFGNSITPGMISDIWRFANEYDIVHTHSHLYFSSNIAALMMKFNNTPLVLTNHGLFSQTAPDALQDIFMKTIAKSTFNSSDTILCYTGTDRDRLRDRGISTPISIIHNGIDCEEFTPEASKRCKSRILFVGRLKKSKGVHRLVDAFAGLADDFPEVTLLLVGEGPLKGELQKQAKNYGLGDRIKFKGRVPNEELPRIYAESTVFALPSDAEGLPRTVLESLACKTPVVTTDLPQLKPLVDGVGKTVPKHSSEELQSALRDILSESADRDQMGSRGRERIVENYSWTETVRQTTEVYYDLIEETIEDS